MSSVKKILYTGNLGFIFSNFVRKAAYEKAPYTFSGLDKVSSPSQLNNIYYNKIISSNYLADVKDQHIINNIFEIEKPDIVIHAATYAPANNSASEIKECFNTNVVGTQVLIDACKKHGTSKIVYLSSDDLYQPTEVNSSHLITESHPSSPRSVVATSQLAAEQLIINSKLNYNILRLCQVYGPRQNKDNIFINAFRAAKNNSPITINGDASQVYDWMHVFDLSSALLLILKSEIDEKTINITSGQECSQLEMLHFICNAIKLENKNYQFTKDYSPGRYAMSSDILNRLGWKPNFKLKVGIEETCNWVALNQWILK